MNFPKQKQLEYLFVFNFQTDENSKEQLFYEYELRVFKFLIHY